MHREICLLLVTAFFVEILVDVADGADTSKPVRSVFIFNHYRKIEEVKNYKFLTNVYVHDLPPADMMKVCTNIARSTYFHVNGYKLINGVSSADRLRNYRVSHSRFGKREMIAAFKCPIDPPVYVQHRGKMIMVYHKKPKNYGCESDADERSTSGGKSWFHNFFRRAKRFFGLKPYQRVRSTDDFLCLGKDLGIAHSIHLAEDGRIRRSDHEEHFIKHTLQPWVLSRVKFGGNIFYGISSVDELVDNLKNGEGGRLHGNVRPGYRVENYFDGTGSGVVSGNHVHDGLSSGTNFDSTIAGVHPQDSVNNFGNDVQTQFNAKLDFDSLNVHQQEFTNTNNIQSNFESKISQGPVDFRGGNTNFENHVLPDEVSSRVNFQSEINSDVDSRINFKKSNNLRPFINSPTDVGNSKSSIDFVSDDHRRQESLFEVNIPPKLDTPDRIHSDESEFGSVSSLPLGRL